MEERISYIFIYYRGHLYKGVSIFDATETNLQQKISLLWTKMFIMNTGIRIKQ